MTSWENKAALITGGGTGVGKATAMILASKGCKILINYSRSEEEAHQTAREITSSGGICLAVRADVADDAACQAMVRQALDAFGRLDALVNNAATTSFIQHADLDAVTPDVWQKIMAVNVQGPFQCIRAACSALKESRGQVVNVASTAGITGIGSSVPYCASKAALINMTMSLARALAPDIRVNAVAPGFISGRWLQAGLGNDYERVKAGLEKKLPLGRVCDPADVAAAIVSLLEGSSLVTGQTLVCDSGLTLGPSFL